MSPRVGVGCWVSVEHAMTIGSQAEGRSIEPAADAVVDRACDLTLI